MSLQPTDFGRIGASLAKEVNGLLDKPEEFAPDQPVDFAALARLGKGQVQPNVESRPSHRASQPIVRTEPKAG